MSFGNEVTIVGNITRDPELRYTPSGASVCNFGVAWNRKYERNGQQVEEVSFFDVVCWQSLADNVSASLQKGQRVIVTGRLDQRTWETPQGEKRSKIEITADDVGPSMRWATVEVARNPSSDNSGYQAPQPAAKAAPAQNDYAYDEEPF